MDHLATTHADHTANGSAEVTGTFCSFSIPGVVQTVAFTLEVPVNAGASLGTRRGSSYSVS
jgi:hypothetical protein